jgi:hypothetical protein
VLTIFSVLFRSFSLWPATLGLPAPTEKFPELMLQLADHALRFAVVLAGPIMAVMFLAEFALAIVSRFTDSPLVWGIHVPAASRFRTVAELDGARYAISRTGSGSHLMAFVHARAQGWPVERLTLVMVGNLDGAVAAFAAGRADVFFWEKLMTKPLVDSGRFDFGSERARTLFPTLGAPYAGFHDMVFAEESSTASFLLRARREGVRDFGACMAPMTAFQILQGIETLPVRMARHVENTRAIVAYLREQPLVEAIGYPELPEHPDHALAQRLLPRGCGSVFSFNLRATREQGRKFIEALRVFSHLANVGDAKSLVIHPASTTHFRMSAEHLLKAGVTEGTIRLSIGLEDPSDLIEDLGRALYAAGKG